MVLCGQSQVTAPHVVLVEGERQNKLHQQCNLHVIHPMAIPHGLGKTDSCRSTLACAQHIPVERPALSNILVNTYSAVR